MLISLWAETTKPVFEGNKFRQLWEETRHFVNPVSQITGEGRAGLLGAWGTGFEREGAGGAGGLNLCAETINH